ncbi:MAG: hypothetical protein JST36_00560 [Bacteroidetes bacterium]|nr:hypothetical protein [Bacteroidota bacterium]
MKPINSKERSKALWQFVFIFFALAMIPVALIFFSYYKVPEEISEAESQKLVAYSNFEHTQKIILKKMAEVDSNINLLASASVENPVMLKQKIADGISELSRMDTSIAIVPTIRASYEKHFTHVSQLVDAQAKLKDATLKLTDMDAKLKAAQSNPMMGMGAPMPMPPGQ